jgi:hypothetical protein
LLSVDTSRGIYRRQPIAHDHPRGGNAAFSAFNKDNDMDKIYTDRQIAAAIGAESHRQLITWRQRGHLRGRKDLRLALRAFAIRVLADRGLNLYDAATAAKTLASLMQRALKDGKGPRLVAISPTGIVAPLPAQLERLPFGGTTLIVFDVNHGAALVRERLSEITWSDEQ